MAIRSLGLVLFIALVSACASGGQHASSGTTSPAPSTPSSGREIFTTKQLASTAAANVYDAINTLEPEVLRGKGRGEPDVYVGSVKQSDGLGRLKQISISSVSSVTYLRYDLAQSLAGEQSSGGAIVVALR